MLISVMGAKTWEDTVLTENQLKEKLGGDVVVGQQASRALKLQAETSFRAGVKEAMEWVKKHYHADTGYECSLYLIDKREKQAKLKEWGLEDNSAGYPKGLGKIEDK